MSRDKPWLKMWTEWLGDAKMDRLSLAEQGAWWRLVSLAHECGHLDEKGEADGALIIAGSPLSLAEIMKSLKISEASDQAIFSQMLDKMKAAGSLHWNSNTLVVTHYQERQRAPTETKRALSERQKKHREIVSSLKANPVPDIAQVARDRLIALPKFDSYLQEHEAIKRELSSLGKEKGYSPHQELTVPSGRIDICWMNEARQPVIAFEIDARLPKYNSLMKLRELDCESFIILRRSTTFYQWEQNTLLIGLGRPKIKDEPADPSPIEEERKNTEAEAEEEHHAQPCHENAVTQSPTPETSNGKSVTLAELSRCYERYIGLLNPVDADRMREFTEYYESHGGQLDWIEKGFKNAPVNKRRWPYVQAILERYIEEGGPDGRAKRAGQPAGQPRLPADRGGSQEPTVKRKWRVKGTGQAPSWGGDQKR